MVNFFLIFILISAPFCNNTMKDFKWGEIKPKSVLQSKGTTTFKSPVFIYSLREKKKLEDRTELMIAEIKYLRKRVALLNDSQEVLKESIKSIEEKHAKSIIALENLTEIQRSSLESLSVAIKNLSSGDNGKKTFVEVAKDLILFHKVIK